MEGTKKIEDAQLHKLTQKRFLNPTITQKVDYQGAKIYKNPKLKSKSKVKVEGSLE